MSRHPMPPVVMPTGQILPHLSSRRRHEVMDTVFEMLGGVERMHHEANKNSTAYWEFVKLWGKGLPRAIAQEGNNGNGGTGSVENLLDRIDAEERAEKITILEPED